MKNLIKLKPSMGLVTATARTNRWLRLSRHRDEIDQLFDLYWGGKERRITRLTLKIIAVNGIVLLTLIIGIMSLGRFQEKIVSSKLDVFQTEIYLLSVALSERSFFDTNKNKKVIDEIGLAEFLGSLSLTLDKKILFFDENIHLRINSVDVVKQEDVKPIFNIVEIQNESLQSVEILKDVAKFVFYLLSDMDDLPLFLEADSMSFEKNEDVREAYLNKALRMSVWRNPDNTIILTAALPVFDGEDIIGVVYLVSDGNEIYQAIIDAWFDIFKIFIFALFSMFVISIYLSGTIARPLKNLARAAEKVRKGKQKFTDIPDLSDRNDEIGDLSVVLREMMQALWERMDAIESFAADVSHEIKNPLTSLKSAVETLSIVKKDEDKKKLLSIIRHDIERLDRLITDISNASRLDAELSRETFSVVDVRQLIRNLLDVYKNPLEREQVNTKVLNDRAMKNGVVIEIVLPQEDCLVLGSEGRLNQVFQNIISNALSFSPLKSKITVLVSKKANTINVAIEDGGPGIPENNLESVFERFYSERPEHESFGSHSGLGLSICKQIVQAHNGVIYAENAKDRSGKVKGARFVVILSALQ